MPITIWSLFILVLCGMPGKGIPHFSWAEAVSFDKWVHAGLFFIEVSLLIPAISRTSTWRILLVSLLATIGYGYLLELGQKFLFADRSFDYYDFIANSIGCLTGVIFARTPVAQRLNKKIFASYY